MILAWGTKCTFCVSTLDCTAAVQKCIFINNCLQKKLHTIATSLQEEKMHGHPKSCISVSILAVFAIEYSFLKLVFFLSVVVNIVPMLSPGCALK